jgi:transglutaminase-like putative cysteine protease
MSRLFDPDARIRAFLDEGPTELSDGAYDAVHAKIDRTRQRVVVGPLAMPRLPSVATFAIGAATVLIVGGIGLAISAERSPSGVGSSSTGSPVRSEWFIDDSVAFTVRWEPGEDGAYYWRAVTYDRLDLRGASVTGATDTIDRPAGAPILEGNADDPPRTGTQRITFTVIPGGFTESTIVSPATPIEVDEATRLTTVGDDGYFVTLDRTRSTGAYTVTALVPVSGNDPGQLDRAALLDAGTDYPTEVRALYTALPAGMWGPNLEVLKQKVLGAAKTQEPIDVAQALEAELRSSAYQYTADMRDVSCGSMSTAECFATVKRGFCQWYAMTMAVVLRDVGIPARIVEGFLPGERSGVDEVIRDDNAHAWVEVYFPRHGWVTFDPTGGDPAGRSPTALPVAPPSGDATP